MKKITLIGGAPLSGKTTLSRELTKRDNAVEISSDSIRSWMKQLVSKDEYPGLFYYDDMTAEEFYQQYDTPESVIEGQIAEGVQVEKGIISLLNTAITWDHLILEGIAITPAFMEKIAGLYLDREVESIVMVDEDGDRIYNRISSRGLWGPLGSYSSSLIPKEVEWVILYNKWFSQQAKKYGIEPHYN